jgi:hypothetical protein
MASQKCEPERGSETATQRLASLLLKQDVRTFIAERRESGVAWRHIARDLYNATDGQVDVTYETLRNWHGGVAA